MSESAIPPRKQRVSLTKTQRNTVVGTELLALCQTMTADGSLSEAEVGELRSWLEQNREVDLPARLFLSATVERILADGMVTQEERTELYKAIESVLPIEIRRDATSRRRTAEKENRERLREE